MTSVLSLGDYKIVVRVTLNLLLVLQIDSEAGKKVTANLKTIEGDLHQMRSENSQLAAQLKS